jgi:hypothetical protein
MRRKARPASLCRGLVTNALKYALANAGGHCTKSAKPQSAVVPRLTKLEENRRSLVCSIRPHCLSNRVYDLGVVLYKAR